MEEIQKVYPPADIIKLELLSIYFEALDYYYLYMSARVNNKFYLRKAKAKLYALTNALYPLVKEKHKLESLRLKLLQSKDISKVIREVGVIMHNNRIYDLRYSSMKGGISALSKEA